MNDVLLRIRSILPELTSREVLVAQYILEDPSHIVNLTISELAALTDVSQATIVRFCKRIGTDGFSHLKLLIAQTYAKPSRNVYDYLKAENAPELTQALLNRILSSLKDTTALLNGHLISKVAEAIARANQVIISGIGGSGACGEIARQRLLRLGISAQVCTESSIMPLVAQTVKAGDVCIGLSHRGNTQSVVEFLEICSRLNGLAVAITTNVRSPVGRAANIALQYVSSDTPVGPEASDARVAQIYVLDVINSTVARILDEQRGREGS